MDTTNCYAPLLELSDRPAFLVQAGTVILANRAARQKMITEGTAIEKHLQQDLPAYGQFEEGCLYLQLSVEGVATRAYLTNLGQFHLFALEDPTEAQLQSLGLAAQQLRAPMSDLFLIAAQVEDPQLSSLLQQKLHKLHRDLSNMADAGIYQQQVLLQPEATDLNSFIYEVVEKASALVQAAGVHIHYSALPQEAMGLVDRQLLERAILNLISNAVKFSPKDQPVQIQLLRKDNMLTLTVRDRGDGIPDPIRHTLFSRYLRTPGIEDSRYGIGLGLCLVRSCAVIHGGTVLIDHPEGIGTRVTMTLRLEPPEDDVLRSPVLFPGIDYAGGHDHALVELSDVLPHDVYNK